MAAQTALTKPGINSVARIGQTFRPVDGATGIGAANVLSRQDGRNWNIAVFNYSSSATNETVNLASAGVPARTFIATNLWDGSTAMVSNSMNVALNAKQAKLFKLALSGTIPLPVINTITTDATGDFVGGGSNGVPGWNYLVLTSSNLGVPLSNWVATVTNCFDSAGNFIFTNTTSRNPGANFQILQVP
jgi:hypothetical protein